MEFGVLNVILNVIVLFGGYFGGICFVLGIGDLISNYMDLWVRGIVKKGREMGYVGLKVVFG